MTEHFHLYALLIAGNKEHYPINAYKKATELLAAYNKEKEHEEDQARLQAALAGATATGSKGSASGDAAQSGTASAQDS